MVAQGGKAGRTTHLARPGSILSLTESASSGNDCGDEQPSTKKADQKTGTTACSVRAKLGAPRGKGSMGQHGRAGMRPASLPKPVGMMPARSSPNAQQRRYACTSVQGLLGASSVACRPQWPLVHQVWLSRPSPPPTISLCPLRVHGHCPTRLHPGSSRGGRRVRPAPRLGTSHGCVLTAHQSVPSKNEDEADRTAQVNPPPPRLPSCRVGKGGGEKKKREKRNKKGRRDGASWVLVKKKD